MHGIKTAGKSSPLTEHGLKIAKNIRASDTVGKYIDRVRPKIPNDANKLKIQQVCFDYAFSELMNIMEQDKRSTVAKAIYKGSGNYQEILIIYGILFRDSIFKTKGNFKRLH